MSGNGLKIKIPIILGLVALLGLLVVACVPSDLQASIKATQADVTSIKANVDKLSKKVDDLSKMTMDPEITMAERDIKEHVVRGRADFIGFQEDFNKLSKSNAGFITAVTGVPAKKDASGAAIPAKPGFIQNINTKLDQLIGVPGKAAVPEKKDPVTEVVTKAVPAVPAKPGIVDGINAKLDALVGIPGKAAIPEKKDAKTGKVTPAKPAVPPVPGVMDELKDIKARLDKIEKSIMPAPAVP